jgi:RNA polymerase sigma-70 factor (ECF subfamily)
MIKAAVAGNRGAFDVIVRQYRPMLIRAVHKQIGDLHRTEDIVAATFETALAQLPEFQGQSSFQTYLYGIAQRLFYQECRHPTHENIDTYRSAMLIENDPAQKRLETEMDLTRAREALSKLPFRYRKVLEMGLIKNMGCISIASRLGIPIGAVCTRLTRARQMFRQAWIKSFYRRSKR